MKIRKVEIQAFKSFLTLEDGTFDFTDHRSGAPAQFISIYAPNGFGKTSFCDAVDYAITGRISRYSRSASIRKLNIQELKSRNESGKIQYIYRNKDAPLKLETLVKVYTDDRDLPFTSNYIKPRNRSSDLDLDFNGNPDTLFFKDVMLFQESIDGFLRETDPESRFEKFAESNEELLTIHEKRKTLKVTIADIYRQIEEQESKRSALDIEILGLELKIENFNQLNSRVLDFNSKYSPLSLPILQASFSEDVYEEFFSAITVASDLVNRDLNDLTISQEFFKKQGQELHIIKSKYEQLITAKKQLVEVSNIIVLKEKEGDLVARLQSFKEERKNVYDQIQRLIIAINQVTPYVEMRTQISDIDARLNILRENLSNGQHLIAQRQENIANNLNHTSEDEKSRLELQLALDSVASTYDLIDSHNVIKSEISKNVKQFDEQKGNARLLISNLNFCRERLKDMRVDEISALKDLSSYIDDAVIKEIGDINLNYEYANYHYSVLEPQIASLTQQLYAVEIQSNQINELISLASDIISKSQLSECPLCRQPYDDLEALRQQIASNPMLSPLAQKLTEQLQYVQSRQSEFTMLRDGCVAKFHLIVTTIDASFESQIREAETGLQKLEFDVAKLNYELTSNQTKLDELLVKVSNSSKPDFTAYLHSKITNLSETIALRAKQSLELENECERLKIGQNDLESEISLLTLNIFQLTQKLAEFDIVRSFIDELFLPDTIEQEQLRILVQTRLDECSKRLVILDGSLESVQNDLIQLQVTHLADVSNSNQDDFKEKKDKLDAVIRELNIDLQEFQRSIQTLAISPPESDEDWKILGEHYLPNKIHADEQLIKSCEKQQSELSLLSSLARQVIGFGSSDDLISKRDNITNLIDKLKNILTNLESDVNVLGKHIQESVDDFFNTELINELYGTIDPHPDFTKVVFNCEIGDRIKLFISPVNPTTSLVTSPNLTFSSAQINVLALSIFLAKALNVTDATGRPVDCIFIDDPVQSIDAINTLSLIDVLRAICVQYNKQIIVTTHDENFHELLKKKMPTEQFSAKYLQLESFGKVGGQL